MKQKIKRKKIFKKGDQCVQNPKNKRFRDQVKKNVFSRNSSKKGMFLYLLISFEDLNDVEIYFTL